MASAVLTYPCSPPEGFQSGRHIDTDHWKKVEAIFPKEVYSDTDSLNLDDRSAKFPIEVLNGRETKPTTKVEGFTLVSKVPTTVSDFADATQVEEAYLAKEVPKIVRSAFPGKILEAIVPFHWLVRDSRRDNYDSSKGPATFNGSSHAPVCRVHGDYTVENAPLRFDELQAKGLLHPDLDKSKVHWGIVNVWKNIGDEPISTKPLALLDVSSVSSNDVFQYWLVNGDRIGRNLAINHNTDHRWMYFPALNSSEAIAFFTYEANAPHPTRQVFHTAFDVSSNSTGPRTSIETRSLVVFSD